MATTTPTPGCAETAGATPALPAPTPASPGPELEPPAPARRGGTRARDRRVSSPQKFFFMFFFMFFFTILTCIVQDTTSRRPIHPGMPNINTKGCDRHLVAAEGTLALGWPRHRSNGERGSRCVSSLWTRQGRGWKGIQAVNYSIHGGEGCNSPNGAGGPLPAFLKKICYDLL
jgi:hypothetical protein